MIYAALFIASIANQAVQSPECGLRGVSQSLNNLRMEVCLKESRPGKGFSSYKVSFKNITDRPIYLFVEDSLLHRFHVQMFINKELFNRRQTDGDGHFPSDLYGEFEPVLIPIGKSISYETNFFSFKARLISLRFVKSSTGYLAFWRPDYYSFDSETGKPSGGFGFFGKADGAKQEKTQNSFSKRISFDQIKIDWDADELGKRQK